MALSKIPADLITGGLSVDPAAPADAITVDSSGNVGIGKTPVNKPLEIYSASDTALRLQNSTTGTGATDGLLLEASGSDVLLVNYENGNMLFYTDTTERVRIDSAGRVTMPYQPAVFAQRTAGSISGNNTIPFDNVLVNTGGHYSSATGRFTAPVAGVYQVICHGIIGNGGSSASADFKVLKNGSAYASGHNNHTDIWDNSVIQCNVYLAVSDYIEIYFTTPNTTAFFGANPSSQTYNGLSIHLIG